MTEYEALPASYLLIDRDSGTVLGSNVVAVAAPEDEATAEALCDSDSLARTYADAVGCALFIERTEVTELPAVGTPLTHYPPLAVYRFACDGDNYSPVPRKEHSGTVTAYTRHDGGITYVIAGDIPNAERALFLLDIAGTITPCYVAGWNPNGSGVYVHPMSGINRSEGGHAWRVGPRRAYHLILTRTDGTAGE